MKEAAARKNSSFGYKSLVKYSDGRTHVPIRHNFKTAEEAKAYAQKWIEANDSRPVGVRKEKWTWQPNNS